jgi:hypothetical protein
VRFYAGAPASRALDLAEAADKPHQRGGVVMSLIGFPLLVIPFAVYNILTFSFPNIALNSEMMRIHLPSGTDLTLTGSDLLVVASMLIMVVETLKATRLSERTAVDHILSVILFCVLLAEFLTIKQAATTTFLLLLTVSLVDVVGGLSIGVVRPGSRMHAAQRVPA